MYVVRTDAPCLACDDVHGYATTGCALAVWIDASAATVIARRLGGKVMDIGHLLPTGIPVALDVRVDGRPHPQLPEGVL